MAETIGTLTYAETAKMQQIFFKIVTKAKITKLKDKLPL